MSGAEGGGAHPDPQRTREKERERCTTANRGMGKACAELNWAGGDERA